jgi:hypothetical protein
MTANEVIHELNSLLRGEIAAVETYRHAFDAIAHFPQKGELAEAQRSHQERVQLLRTNILRLGGEPVDGSGLWGAFASVVEKSATVLGDRAVIAALEEGEERGLRDYRSALGKLAGDARELVELQLLPEQLRTQRALAMLKQAPKH